MNLSEYITVNRNKKNFFSFIFNYSFPMLCFLSFKFQIDTSVSLSAIKICYDAENIDIRDLEELAKAYFDEDIDKHMCILIISFLKFASQIEISNSLQKKAIKQLLSINKAIQHKSTVIQFIRNVQNDSIIELCDHASLFSSSLQYWRYINDLPNGYAQFIREIDLLHDKASIQIPLVNHLFRYFEKNELVTKY